MKRLTIKEIDKIHRVLKHPDIWEHIIDDGTCSIDEYDVSPLLKNDGVYFLMPDDDTLFMAIQINAIMWDIHINALKGSRGSKSIKAAHEAFKYMFTKTPCQKLVVYIAEIFPNVVNHAVRCGFVQEGNITNSYLKNGELYSQYLLGISKSEYGDIN